MSVTAVIPWNFVSMTGDTKEVQIEGKTVGECLDNLVEKHPSLKPDLFNKTGKLHNDIIISVNKKMIYPEQLDKPVEEGDKINISVLIGGG